jgi:hypothetical protein
MVNCPECECTQDDDGKTICATVEERNGIRYVFECDRSCCPDGCEGPKTFRTRLSELMEMAKVPNDKLPLVWIQIIMVLLAFVVISTIVLINS